jgi:hypothetical protein
MRVSLRNSDGDEVDAASAVDGESIAHEAMVLIVRHKRLAVGDLLSVDPDDAPREQPGGLLHVSAGNLRSVCARLEARANVIERVRPEDAADLRIAARFCRHAIKVGWIVSSVAVA